MTIAKRGLFDTSVFIAAEVERALAVDRLPAEAAISVVTLAELHAGVLAATSAAVRAQRLATLESVADIEVLPIGEAVAARWAALRVELAERRRRVNVNDVWIAATAITHDLPVVTQDRDFEPLEGIAGFVAIRV